MQSQFNQTNNTIVFQSNSSQTALRFMVGNQKFHHNLSNEINLVAIQNLRNDSKLKRESSCHKQAKQYQLEAKKRTKLNQQTNFNKTNEDRLNLGFILKALDQHQDNYFGLQNQKSTQINGYNQLSVHSKKIIFPDAQLQALNKRKNQLLKRSIQIMSNKNTKISIPIHEGLYKSNTSHKNQFLQEKWNQIPNLCDFKLKNQYSESIQFIREYKSGYAPIEMQKKNNQDIQEEKTMKQNTQSSLKGVKDKTRNHFIRKQQSTLTLPRTCGVSYIKQSESIKTQLKPFQPLPPLIFQGSTTCFIGSNAQSCQNLASNKKQLFGKFIESLQNSWLAFVMSDQSQMRDLLLGKRTKNSQVGFVQGIQNGSFILIMISPNCLSTQKQVWQCFQAKQTFFKIGILAKKSTSGRKAFLKSIKADFSDTISLESQQTKQNQMKDEYLNNYQYQKKGVSSYQKIIALNSKESFEQQKKVSNTFELLQEQLKDNRTVVTMSIRLQMYVEQSDWKQNYSRENKDFLNEIITGLKDKLQKKSIRIIQQRFEILRSQNPNLFQEKYPFLRKSNENSNQIQVSHDKVNLISSHNIRAQNLISTDIFDQKSKILKLNTTDKTILFSNTCISSVSDFLKNSNQEAWKKSLKFPIYYISTRDSFAFDLIEKTTKLKRQNGRQYTRVDYYFYPDNVPTNFGSQYRKLFPQFDVGVTSYHGFFSDEELKNFQQNTFQMENKAFKNQFLQMTVQPSIVSTKIKRTKFFFGYRYMWTRCQLSEPASYVGAGVRKDVTSPPEWTKQISNQMVKQNIVQKNFINSIAINVYHDGKQGLAQHFDDAVRFKQPIFTLRLFSDARLSFGSQFYGFCNGAFIIPLPRGCVLVMQQNSYAANGVKHCVRPCDMTGKSAAVILRQMHSQVVSQASKYDEYVDFPAWLSCLSQNEKAISYAEQKRLESQHIMKVKID